VVVRDPTGRRQDEAFILEACAPRWTMEVTFHDAKQHLGLADPQSQAPHAVRRTAALAFLVCDLVGLWYAEHARAGGGWPARPWSRDKAAPSFQGMAHSPPPP
jgi:hypothetical protein